MSSLTCDGSYVWQYSWILPIGAAYEDVWLSSPYVSGSFLIGNHGYFVRYPGNKLSEAPTVPRSQRLAL